VSIAPGLIRTAGRDTRLVRRARGARHIDGVGLVGAMIADRHDMVLHAGWDVPNYRWYELEGLRVGSTTSGTTC
jgi:hypothetical protein